MTGLELEFTGEIPAGLDMVPTQAVFAALVEQLQPLITGTINVALVDDERIQQLNREQAGNDYATDVLSFSYIEDGGEPIEGVIGEMAVSLDTAARQADEAGTTLAEELALLVLHGTLHILSYDHQTVEDQERMQVLQRQLMTAAGYHYREFTWQG